MIAEFSKAVCLPELDILEKSGRGIHSDCRQLYWLILQNNGFGICDIAKLSGKTHGSVSVGISRIRSLIESGDKQMTRLYNLTKHIKR